MLGGRQVSSLRPFFHSSKNSAYSLQDRVGLQDLRIHSDRFSKEIEIMTMPKEKAVEDGIQVQESNKDPNADAMEEKARVNTSKALTSSTQPPRRTLPFPAEIRRQVFGYLFHRSFNIFWRIGQPKSYPDSLNILQVSSTVYQEAYEVLCDTATFRFDIYDNIKYGFSLRIVNGESVTKIIPRIKHARVIFSHLYPDSGYYRQAIKSINELVCAVAQNDRLRSLELVMNEHGLEKLTTMEALQFLNLAIPTRIHFYGPGVSKHDVEKLNHIRAHCDKTWGTFLREAEARNGPVEVEAVSTGQHDWVPCSVSIYFEATLRLKKVSTSGAPTISRTNPRRLGRDDMEASLAMGESFYFE